MKSSLHRQSFLAAAVLALGLPLLASNALAQAAYPSRPITVIVPNAAGGGADTVARSVAPRMSALLNAAFIIDDRPGANGNIAATLAAKAQPDGYTVLLGQTSQFATNPHMYAQMPFDGQKDFVPIVMLADAPNVIVVAADSPFHTLKDIVDAARVSKDGLDFATPGAGTVSHLIGAMFQQAANIKLVHVPYKGGPPAITDTLAGRTAFMVSAVPSTLPQVKGGKMRAIAVSATRRSPSLPNVPTIAEAGYPGFDAGTWYGLFVPTGTPPEVVKKLGAAANEALKSPEVIERLRSEGGDTVGGSADVLVARIKKDYAQLGQAVKASGAKVE
ncbi:MAG: tripartite tricarboxylate transporter substrate binding protein [Pseudomonadota bacterium]